MRRYCWPTLIVLVALAAQTRADNSLYGQESELIQQRFPNGSVQIERWVRENERGDFVNHGTFTQYSNNGTVLTTGEFHNGQQVGGWERTLDGAAAKQLAGYMDAGFEAPFHSKAIFKDGKLEGDWTCADAKGNLLFVWSLKSGQRDGLSTWFNSKGKVIQSIPYRSNLAHGIATITEKTAKEVRFDNGRKLTESREFYNTTARGKDRVLKSHRWLLTPTPLNIVAHEWHANKVVYQKTTADQQPIEHGSVVTYFPNKQKEFEGEYRYGKRTGAATWWYANGQKKATGQYQDHAEHGQWSWWHENGIRQARGGYSNGQKIGEWSTWSPQGKLASRVDMDKSNRKLARIPIRTSKNTN